MKKDVRSTWLTRIIKKMFGIEIIIVRGSFYIHMGIHQCDVCKNGIRRLPFLNGKSFGYKSDPSLKIEYSSEFEHEKLSTKGWTIEYKYRHYPSGWNGKWNGHWNHKIYRTFEEALDALNQTKYTQSMVTHPSLRRDTNNCEFRIIPLYEIDQTTSRSIQIEKIFE